MAYNQKKRKRTYSRTTRRIRRTSRKGYRSHSRRYGGGKRRGRRNFKRQWRRAGFGGRVKGVVKKMHGLNKRQYAGFYVPWDQEVQPGSSQYALTQTIVLDSPQGLSQFLPTLFGNTTDDSRYTEVYIKKFLGKMMYFNHCNYPCWLEYTYLRSRVDIPAGSTLEQLMSADGPLPYLAYISPFTGNSFQKQFKILKTRKKLIQPGKFCTVKFKKTFYPKAYTGAVQGNTAKWFALEGNLFLYIRAYGYPLLGHDTGDNHDFSLLGKIELSRLALSYISYYVMDDVRPDSTVAVQIPTPVPVNTVLHRMPILVHGDDIVTSGSAKMAQPVRVVVSAIPDQTAEVDTEVKVETDPTADDVLAFPFQNV